MDRECFLRGEFDFIFFAVNINAMKRPTGLAAKYASDATHRITSSIRKCVAAGIETPTPVPIAM